MSTIQTDCGNLALFAIECEVFIPTDPDWIFGHFRFWLGGIAVGNWSDTTSLIGCINWLQEFTETPVNRYEPGLLSIPKEEIFHLLCDNVKWEHGEYQPYADTYGRFHINHLGMSAFDQYDILLVENQEQQRILWRKQENSTIYDVRLPANEMQKVAKLFLDWFMKDITNSLII